MAGADRDMPCREYGVSPIIFWLPGDGIFGIIVIAMKVFLL
jgi:hypothetical protein